MLKQYAGAVSYYSPISNPDFPAVFSAASGEHIFESESSANIPETPERFAVKALKLTDMRSANMSQTILSLPHHMEHAKKCDKCMKKNNVMSHKMRFKAPFSDIQIRVIKCRRISTISDSLDMEVHDDIFTAFNNNQHRMLHSRNVLVMGCMVE